MPSSPFAQTPEPPFHAVIFSSLRTAGDVGYAAMGQRMAELAAQQPGYLGVESVRGEDGFGITVSYWASDEAARAWKAHAEHRIAQEAGRERWYSHYELRVARVERAYEKPAPYVQLQMVWPERLLDSPPSVTLPAGYALRTYRPGDEPRFCEVMALSGWPGWDDARLRPWIARIPPGSWFMVVHEAGDQIVATAMGLHDHSDTHPFGGELGWVASDPAHAGKGLGMAVCAAVTGRLLAAGYRNIHLFTEHWRLAALKTYLKLGYVPFLYTSNMAERWRVVCEQLRWPFAPEDWRPLGG